jgi:predicted outer membrane repeat protein
VLANTCSKNGGAVFVTAIDNDERSIEKAGENIRQNNCHKISPALTNKPLSEKIRYRTGKY